MARIKKTTDNKGHQSFREREPSLTIAIVSGLARYIQPCSCGVTILVAIKSHSMRRNSDLVMQI